MELKIGVDLVNKTLLGPDGAGLTLPPITQGDTISVVLQGMELLDTGDYRRVPIPFSTIKCGIGFIDAAAKDGAFTLRVDGEDTEAMAYNTSKNAVETKLNALAAVTVRGGLKVIAGGAANIFAVKWNDAAVTTPISVSAMSLYPKCFSRVVTWDLDYGLIFLIKLFQAPVAFTDQFHLPMPPAVESVRVRVGTGTRNEVQKITVPAGSQGEFSMTWNGLTTGIVAIPTASRTAIAAALNDLYTDGVERFRVTQPGTRYYYVEFVGPLEKAPQALLTITMESQPVIETPTGTLALTGPGVEAALDGKSEIAMRLEIEVINDGESGTPVQAEILVLNDMIDDPMAIVADPDWVQQLVDPVAWVEHDHSQIIVGERNYVASVGDAVLSVYNITHNLGTLNVHVTVRENGGSNLRIPDDQYECLIVNSNQVRITWPTVPVENQYVVIISSSGPESYFLGHEHTTDEIKRDGVTLSTILDALSAASNPLELWPSVPLNKLPAIPFSQLSGQIADTQIPSTIARLDSDGFLPLTTIPPEVPRIGPDGALVWKLRASEIWSTLVGSDGLLDAALLGDMSRVPGFSDAVKRILTGSGASAAALEFTLPSWNELYPGKAPAPKSFDDIEGASVPGTYVDYAERVKRELLVKTSTLPRPGGLLPAIHDATVTDLTIPIPAAGSPYTGNVYLNNSGSDIALPGGMGRKGSTLKAGEHAACDGRVWYRVAREGSTTSYHPRDFDRELVLLDVNESMFPVGSIFTLQLDLATQILLSETRAQWVVIVEIGAFAAVGSGAGTNISGITWGATPVITCPIHLTAIRTPHAFGVRFTRGASVITAETKLYRGAWTASATAPAGPGFAVRARLAKFDTEDSLTDPRGYVLLAVNPNKISLATIV